MVASVTQTRDGTLVSYQGLSELVAGNTSPFIGALDDIVSFTPRPGGRHGPVQQP